MKKWMKVMIAMVAVLSLGLLLTACGGGNNYQCTKNADCTGANQYCDLSTHTCKTNGCTNGATQCSGNELQTCTNAAWVNTTDCTATGKTCTTTGGVAQCTSTSCTNGQKQCSGTKVQTCTNNAWVDGQDCSTTSQVCANGACITACTAGAKQCNGTKIQTCTGGVWVDGTDCAQNTPPQICDQGACASTCTNGNKQCNGTIVQTCMAGAWVNGTDCHTTNQTCSAGNCVGGCTAGTHQCNGTKVQTCTNNAWVDGQDCAQLTPPESCSNGACSGCTPNCTGKYCGDSNGCTGKCTACQDVSKTCNQTTWQCEAVQTTECPTGQTCTALTDGTKTCEVGGNPPQGAQTGCSDTVACTTMNDLCICTAGTPPNCTATVCLGLCGTCGTDLLCEVINTTDGVKGCLTTDGYTPTGAPTGCHSNNWTCTGNATCWCTSPDPQNCTASVCIDNCSLDGACTNNTKRCDGTVPYTCTNTKWVAGTDCANTSQVCYQGACASADLCPTGQVCTAIGSLSQCLMPDGSSPTGLQMGCSSSSPCQGNTSCYYTDSSHTTTECLMDCGTCPTGSSCKAVGANGKGGCVNPDNSNPDTQTGCNPPSVLCTGNAACYSGTPTQCYFNCSNPQ